MPVIMATTSGQPRSARPVAHWLVDGTSEVGEGVGALGEQLARLPDSAVGLGRRLASRRTGVSDARRFGVRGVHVCDGHGSRVDFDDTVKGRLDGFRLRDHHPRVEGQQPKAEQASMNHRPDQHGAFAARGAHAATHPHGPGPEVRRTAAPTERWRSRPRPGTPPIRGGLGAALAGVGLQP